jgi:serine protease AprX
MEGMHFRGVSWVTDAGKATRRAVVASTMLGVAALGMPSADANATLPGGDRVTVVVRVENGSRAAQLFRALGGQLSDGWDGHTMRAVVPRAQLDRLRDVPGVIEIAVDQTLNFQPTSEPVALNHRSEEPGAFVEADHGHNEGGLSFPYVDLEVVNDIVNTERAHRRTAGAGVDVALIDTGVAPVAGVGAVLNGPDLSFDGSNPAMTHLDAYGHGTHLAGIINGDTAAAPGIAPGARIVNVKVGAADGAVDVSQVIAGIDWVVQHRNDPGVNIRVLVLAYGTDSLQPYQIDPLAAAVENAWRNGIVVVAAAGNRGVDTVSLDNPALDPYVVAVGASEPNGTYSTSDDTMAPFSNGSTNGRHADLVAPGRSIVSLRVPGGYIDTEHPEGRVGTELFRGSGTSQAAAVVAGGAALLLADRPELTPDQVKYLLESTARPLRYQDADLRQGAGVVDISRAMAMPTPRQGVATQTWPVSDGSGSLEAARGSYHVVNPQGAVLTGEYTVWSGTSWSGTSWSGTSWSGTSWSGTSWSGTSWSGQSWSGTSWSGGSWSGTSWSGTSWSGGTWLGTSWSGTSWSGQSWSGTSWSGTSWSGTSWSGTSWSGTSWSGTSWSGTSWSGTSWSGLRDFGTAAPPPATSTSTSTTPTTTVTAPEAPVLTAEQIEAAAAAAAATTTTTVVAATGLGG